MKTYNDRLRPLPSDDEVVAAVESLIAETRWADGVTANEVAWRLGIEPARRLGRQAQGPHSWSGSMSPALRIAPRLRSLADRGRLSRYYDTERHRYRYLPAAGRWRAQGSTERRSPLPASTPQTPPAAPNAAKEKNTP